MKDVELDLKYQNDEKVCREKKRKVRKQDLCWRKERAVQFDHNPGNIWTVKKL